MEWCYVLSATADLIGKLRLPDTETRKAHRTHHTCFIKPRRPRIRLFYDFDYVINHTTSSTLPLLHHSLSAHRGFLASKYFRVKSRTVFGMMARQLGEARIQHTLREIHIGARESITVTKEQLFRRFSSSFAPSVFQSGAASTGGMEPSVDPILLRCHEIRPALILSLDKLLDRILTSPKQRRAIEEFRDLYIETAKIPKLKYPQKAPHE